MMRYGQFQPILANGYPAKFFVVFKRAKTVRARLFQGHTLQRPNSLAYCLGDSDELGTTNASEAK